MGKESALAFMNVGQALRLTNISALKMALSMKKALTLHTFYICFFYRFGVSSRYSFMNKKMEHVVSYLKSWLGMHSL